MCSVSKSNPVSAQFYQVGSGSLDLLGLGFLSDQIKRASGHQSFGGFLVGSRLLSRQIVGDEA